MIGWYDLNLNQVQVVYIVLTWHPNTLHLHIQSSKETCFSWQHEYIGARNETTPIVTFLYLCIPTEYYLDSQMMPAMAHKILLMFKWHI